jgi:hypothetical protein
MQIITFLEELKLFGWYAYIHICISLTFQPKIVAIFNQKHCVNLWHVGL